MFNAGDHLEVRDCGYTFDRWYECIEQNIPGRIGDWVAGVCPDNGDECYVLMTDVHPYDNTPIYIVEGRNHQVYVMGENGLRRYKPAYIRPISPEQFYKEIGVNV